jgi:hypothetical protein
MNKQQRTQMILDHERGHAFEWTRLHAVLCVPHGWDLESSCAYDLSSNENALIDGGMIAALACPQNSLSTSPKRARLRRTIRCASSATRLLKRCAKSKRSARKAWLIVESAWARASAIRWLSCALHLRR